MSNGYVVIMAGGKGERFWPRSRLHCPKQLLPIVGDSSMLAQTVERLRGLVLPERVIVIVNRVQRAAALAACPQLPTENIVAEPVGRDTAAAVGLAAVLVAQRDQQATLAMLPADQVIHDSPSFRSVLQAAFEAAAAHPWLVTIGIQPTEPATGYGYIQRGSAKARFAGRDVFDVRRFVEKPTVEVAREYLAGGDYLWNAGMFIWSVASIQAAITRHVPELAAGLETIQRQLADGRAIDDTLAEHYPRLPRNSVDYAIMEKADNVVTLAGTFDWDDVGAWPAIMRHLPGDERGNVIQGQGLVEAGSGNLVVSSGEHIVALLGVEDLVVVHTVDATLVCARSHAQQVKQLLKRLETQPHWQKTL